MFLCFPAEDRVECKAVADVGFIVDSSGSLARHYAKEKEFVKLVARNLDVSDRGSHVAVVLFSYHSELSIKFSDYNNADGFGRAVDNLPLMKSTTRIDKALRTAYNEMFSERNGMRIKVPKILVLLTDGEQTRDADAVSPSQIIQKFHDADIKVIVVGIGRGVNPAELRSLVKSQDNLYLAKDFEQLKSTEFVDGITGSACLQTGEFLYANNVSNNVLAFEQALNAVCPVFQYEQKSYYY